MPKPSYRAGLDVALHGTGLPYGYTVTIWGTGQLLIDGHGTPSVGLIVLFAAGAAAAYGVLRLAAHDVSASPQRQLSDSPHLLRAGAFHLAAIGGALGIATLVGELSSAIVWPLGGFAATVVYLGVAALELATREHEEVGDGG
ncbi:MAG: hypothetical protein ACLGI5_14185 [Thermoleophilia bacterium]